MREPDPPTRDGAQRAGWRYGHTHAGHVLVLRHAGTRIGRWRVIAHDERIGVCVQRFKAERSKLQFGALAIWHAGTVSRFEQAEVRSLVGKCGEPDR